MLQTDTPVRQNKPTPPPPPPIQRTHVTCAPANAPHNYQARSDIAFPLLVLLAHKPVAVEWDKEEVMRLCGYNDRLQSSRRILLDGNEGARAVLARCNAVIQKHARTGSVRALAPTHNDSASTAAAAAAAASAAAAAAPAAPPAAR